MPAALTENDLRTYRISYDDTPTLSEEVQAAYFVTDGDFLNFKNHAHKVVFAARVIHVVAVRDVTVPGTGMIHVGSDEFQKLTPSEQSALKGWVKSFFDCDPDHIEWLEFTLDPSVVNWAMQINLLIPEDLTRSTLVSELHNVRVSTLVPEGLLVRLAEVGAGHGIQAHT
jgi:hypothetical protein